jgi:prevent-host-death family protein
MPKPAAALDLAIDLERGVVPISKAASSLAALLKRARERGQPIVITQKGYPSGVILDIELYTALRSLVAAADPSEATAAPPEAAATAEVEPSAPVVAAPPAEAPARPARGGRRSRRDEPPTEG